MRDRSVKYRKIYETHYGPIPIDHNGRSYDIHHINGNHNDNRPENLKAVSVEEHYNIHYEQGDYSSCLFISHRMNLSPEEISDLAKKSNEKRLLNGTHNFQQKQFREKYNPIIAETVRQKVKNGTHNFQQKDFQKNVQKELVKTGRHNFSGDSLNRKMLERGTHVTQIKISCIYCKKICGKHAFVRWHGINCKFRNDNVSTRN